MNNSIDYLARKVAMNVAFGDQSNPVKGMEDTFGLNTQSIIMDKEVDIFRRRVEYHALDFMGDGGKLSDNDRVLIDRAIESVVSMFKEHGRGVVPGEPRNIFSELEARSCSCRGAFYLLPNGKDVVRCQAAYPEFDGVLLDGFKERLAPCQAVELSFDNALRQLKDDIGYDRTFLPLENDGKDGLSFRHGDVYYVRGLPNGLSVRIEQLPDAKLGQLFDEIHEVKRDMIFAKHNEKGDDRSLVDLMELRECSYYQFPNEGPAVSLVGSDDLVQLFAIWLTDDASLRPVVRMQDINGKVYSEGDLSDRSVRSLKTVMHNVISKGNLLDRYLGNNPSEGKKNPGLKK